MKWLKSSDSKAQKCSQTYARLLKHVSDSRLLYFFKIDTYNMTQQTSWKDLSNVICIITRWESSWCLSGEDGFLSRSRTFPPESQSGTLKILINKETLRPKLKKEKKRKENIATSIVKLLQHLQRCRTGHALRVCCSDQDFPCGWQGPTVTSRKQFTLMLFKMSMWGKGAP